jgi:drug/metabolite transporter (DMT)-like permease
MNNLLGLLISTVAASVVWQMPSARQWVALVAIGGLMAIAQLCFVNAMARSDASFVSPFLYCTLIFAAFYDAVVFEVMPGFISLLGAGIVLAGAALLAWREALSHGRTQPSSVIK